MPFVKIRTNCESTASGSIIIQNSIEYVAPKFRSGAAELVDISLAGRAESRLRLNDAPQKQGDSKQKLKALPAVHDPSEFERSYHGEPESQRMVRAGKPAYAASARSTL